MSSTPSDATRNTAVTPPPKQPSSSPAAQQSLSVAAASIRKRRSARVLEHDPIIAPGFGTSKDVARLANQLGLSFDEVQEIMSSRGQRGSGSRSSTRGVRVDTEESAPSQDASVWADFLGEEGVSQAAASAMSNAQGNKRNYQLDSISVSKDASKKSKLAAGALIQAGTLDSSIVGRTKSKLIEIYHCAIPSQIMPQTKIAAVFTGCNSCHSIALAQNGTIYGWGRNESQQLGANLPPNVVLPTVLDVPGSSGTGSPSTLVQAATGKGHTLFLMQDGSVYAVGANKVGQCGAKTSADTVPRPKKCTVVDDMNNVVDCHVRMIACGEDFSVLLDTEGFVYSTGSSEFGQLGNGETGEYFIQANKLAFANCNVFTRRCDHWYYQPDAASASSSQPNVVLELLPDAGSIKIQAIACGKHHTIALEAESSERPRLFTWGCGNYGCLGHGRQADEYYPRQMQMLPLTCDPTNAKIAAGAHCNLIQTANGHVYYNGKHRSVGEATMKPVLIEQLATNQHVITSCAGGFQSVVCCTDIGNTVAWGQGPYGELGLKDQKSSAKPAFVEALSGIPMMQVACGYGHTLFLADDDDKVAKDALKLLPVVTHAAVETLLK